jgi:hypothetical protein
MTDFHDIPLEVSSLFNDLATKLRNDGWEHYSADAILHRIRWHFQIERGRRDFKCNNNWTAVLARWWLERHPQHAGFFELRALATERKSAGFLPQQEAAE